MRTLCVQRINVRIDSGDTAAEESKGISVIGLLFQAQARHFVIYKRQPRISKIFEK